MGLQDSTKVCGLRMERFSRTLNLYLQRREAKLGIAEEIERQAMQDGETNTETGWDAEPDTDADHRQPRGY